MSKHTHTHKVIRGVKKTDIDVPLKNKQPRYMAVSSLTSRSNYAKYVPVIVPRDFTVISN